MNMTLFRNRVFADIINWNRVGPKSNEWCSHKERAIWRRTHSQGSSRVKTQAVTGEVQVQVKNV